MTTPITTSQGMANYKIKPGDMLSRIAKRFKVSINDLKKLNTQIKDADHINTGDNLKIPGFSSHNVNTDTDISLNLIAKMYGTNAVYLREINNLLEDVLIQNGQVLYVPNKTSNDSNQKSTATLPTKDNRPPIKDVALGEIANNTKLSDKEKIKKLESTLSTININNGLTNPQVCDIQESILLLLIKKNNENPIKLFNKQNKNHSGIWDGIYGKSVKKFLKQITNKNTLKEALPVLLKVFRKQLLDEIPKLTIDPKVPPVDLVEKKEVEDVSPALKTELPFTPSELKNIFTDLKLVNELIQNSFMVSSQKVSPNVKPNSGNNEQLDSFKVNSRRYPLSKTQIVSLQKALYFHWLSVGDKKKAEQFMIENTIKSDKETNELIWDGGEGPSLRRNIGSYLQLTKNGNIFEGLMNELIDDFPDIPGIKKQNTSMLAIIPGKRGLHIGFNPNYFSEDSRDIINRANASIMTGKFNEYIGGDKAKRTGKDKADCWDYKTSIVGMNPNKRTKVRKDVPELIKNINDVNYKVGTAFHTNHCSLTGSGSSHWGILVKDKDDKYLILNRGTSFYFSNLEHFFRKVPKPWEANYATLIQKKFINYEVP